MRLSQALLNNNMRYFLLLLQLLFLILTIVFPMRAANAQSCTGRGLELQVLGSGGPEMQDKRASSSYLIWLDGKARVLIDSGGGSALRFGESGAQMADIDLVLFTHLHVDHSADFPALIKSTYFEDRTRPLPVYGPIGNAAFPSTQEFVQVMFGLKGAYRYLNDFIEPGKASYAIQASNVAINAQEVKQIFNQNGIKASATQMRHGGVPALAWRIDIAEKSLVFSGDTNGNNGNLQRLAHAADLLVAHNAVPESATGAARNLHMTPSVIGRIAAEAKVKQLVLSHRMLRTLGREAETLQAIAQNFVGKPVFADDLDCFAP